jgi:hypothetical protein
VLKTVNEQSEAKRLAAAAVGGTMLNELVRDGYQQNRTMASSHKRGFMAHVGGAGLATLSSS